MSMLVPIKGLLTMEEATRKKHYTIISFLWRSLAVLFEPQTYSLQKILKFELKLLKSSAKIRNSAFFSSSLFKLPHGNCWPVKERQQHHCSWKSKQLFIHQHLQPPGNYFFQIFLPKEFQNYQRQICSVCVSH